MPKKIPKYIKFIYKKKERLWVKVTKIIGTVYYGKIYNNPITKGIKFNDDVKIKLADIVEYIY